MRTAADCLKQAEALEKLAESEPDGFRRTAYLEMAAYWREVALRRKADRPSE